MDYFVYILECADKTLYTGITSDLNRRLDEHNLSHLGAKYTAGRRPVEIVYFQKLANRSKALKEEARIKALSRVDKLGIISQFKAKKSKKRVGQVIKGHI